MFDGEHMTVSEPVIRSMTDSVTGVAAGPTMPSTPSLSRRSTVTEATCPSVPESPGMILRFTPDSLISVTAMKIGWMSACTMTARPPVWGMT